MTEAKVNALLTFVDEAFWTQASLLTDASERLPALTRPHLSDGLHTIPLLDHEFHEPSLKNRVNGYFENPPFSPASVKKRNISHSATIPQASLHPIHDLILGPHSFKP
jgi:hypothetical protein